MENRTFDKFVQLLGNYLENRHLGRWRRAQQKEWGQSKSHGFLSVSPQPGPTWQSAESPLPQLPKSGAGPRAGGTGQQPGTAPAAPTTVQSAGGASAAQPGMSGRLKRSPALLFPRPGLRGEGLGEGTGRGGKGGGGRREKGGAGAGGASAERALRARLTDHRGGCKMAQAALPLRPRRS